MGISRAEELRKKIIPFIDEAKLVISSKLLDGDFSSDWEQAYSFRIENGDLSEAAFSESPEILTLFFSKNEKNILNEAISTKLKSIANEMMKNGLGANIICHTDPTSNSKKDYDLGKVISDQVKDFLVTNGVSEDEIRSSSMGSSQPVNGDSNRRVQIIFSSK